ncbi:hypothetical protein ACWD6P_04610 [Streptomyces sp. NPDC002446]
MSFQGTDAYQDADLSHQEADLSVTVGARPPDNRDQPPSPNAMTSEVSLLCPGV